MESSLFSLSVVGSTPTPGATDDDKDGNHNEDGDDDRPP